MTAFFCFSENTSANDTAKWNGDTIYNISATDLKAAIIIFKERDFLLSENSMLKIQIHQFEHLTLEKENIIQSKSSQFGVLNEIITKKDMALTNCDAMIDNLKIQVKKEQIEQKKYFLYGTGAGIVISGVLVLIFK